MELINTTIERIKWLGRCKAAYTMAQALYSACHHGSFPAPSLLNVSSGLDCNNRELFCRLTGMVQEPDYSNASQAKALEFIEQEFGEEIINRWKQGE